MVTSAYEAKNMERGRMGDHVPGLEEINCETGVQK